jgi:hypothetical protein
MTLLDAPQYDAKRDRRRRILIVATAVVVVVGAALYLYWPHYQATRTVDRFFEALMNKNYQEAYAIWQADPKLYSMDAFMKDWGPQSKWGVITSFRIDQLGIPPGGHASGLVALVRINGIQSDEARLWVQNGTEEMSFYQF